MNADALVYVVDDDESVRDSLALLLETAGFRVSVYETARGFLDKFDPQQPGCLLLDVRLKNHSGLDLQEQLSATGSRLPVIMITGHGDVAIAVRAMRSGAFDFIEKPFDNEALLDRIRQAIDLDSRTRLELKQKAEIEARIARLTRREREVMDAVVLGHPNKRIALDLGISSKTVEAHRAHVMGKMQADSLAELVRQVERARATSP